MNLQVDNRLMAMRVRDQRDRPTCLSHAITAAHEIVRGVEIPLSPEYLHYFAIGGTDNRGATFDGAGAALQEYGQPTEHDCPYSLARPAADWRPAAGVVVFKRKIDIQKSSPDEIDNLLQQGATPVLGISLPDGFFGPSSPWLIPPDGPIRGLHAVVAVGLGSDSGDRAVLVQNSWGAGWGDGGFAWLADEFLEQHLVSTAVVSYGVHE